MRDAPNTTRTANTRKCKHGTARHAQHGVQGCQYGPAGTNTRWRATRHALARTNTRWMPPNANTHGPTRNTRF